MKNITAEDKIEMGDLIYRLFAAIDIGKSVDKVLSCVSEDGELDYSDFGYGSYRGHDVIAPMFIDNIFPMTEWGIHHITNFHITETNEDTVKGLAYLNGKVSLKGQDPMDVHAGCDCIFRRTSDGWKIQYLREYAIVPMGNS